MKTLYLGSLQAQFKVCRGNLEHQVLPEVDEVIQLGNLISCSKAAKDKRDSGRNEAVLTFWDKIQLPKTKLIGRNEIAALNLPNEWTNNNSNTYLRDGWLSDNPDYLVAAVDKERLITHGGLTFGEWTSIGAPTDANTAADRLNEKYSRTLSQGKCLQLDQRPNLSASPIWVDPVLELYPSWVLAEVEPPFDQLHGGESLNTERGRAAAAHPSHPLFYLDSVSYRKFGSIAVIKGAIFRGVDVDLPFKSIPSLPADKAFYVETS